MPDCDWGFPVFDNDACQYSCQCGEVLCPSSTIGGADATCDCATPIGATFNVNNNYLARSDELCANTNGVLAGGHSSTAQVSSQTIGMKDGSTLNL